MADLATAPGSVSYFQWVYSSGQPGPVQTVHFIAGGHQVVQGKVLKTTQAASGWGEIKLVNPAGKASNKASYKKLCASAAAGRDLRGGVRHTSPATPHLTCGTASPSPFTASRSSVTSKKAETVSYYWALSDGQTSAPATLTFTAPGTMAAESLSIAPTTSPASGQAVLVVTSPAAVASAAQPAAYNVSCTPPVVQNLTESATVSPASDSLALCTSAAPVFTFSGTIGVTKAATSMQLLLEAAKRRTVRSRLPLAFAGPGSKPVTAATYKPS